MKTIWFLILCKIWQLGEAFEIIDYSNEPYALIPDEKVYLFSENGTLFHVFNITLIEDKFRYYEKMIYNHNKSDLQDKKLRIMAEKCREYINQLTVHRSKRAMNFLGTIMKFVTGTPDHDDMEMVQRKLNDLIENNNKLAIINTKLQRNLEFITGNSVEHHLELLFEWLLSELTEIIHTINLAKMGILNTAVLNVEEINQIIKAEGKFDAPLMEILEGSTFKIIQAGSIYVLLLRYPKIESKCVLFAVRPIGTDQGKLELANEVAHCNGRYHSIRECKKGIGISICRNSSHSCTERLLNGEHANCSLIRERMLSLDVVDDGRILLHGTHSIDGVTKTGTFLVLFNGTVKIDDVDYASDRGIVLEYLRRNRPAQYEILKILEAQNGELEIPRLTMLEAIPIEIVEHPVRSFIFLVTTIVSVAVIFHVVTVVLKIYTRIRQTQEQQRTEMYLRTLFHGQIADNLN